jgi:hypothetical protein
VPVTEGTLTIVYAWGSAEDENLDLAVQTITGLHSSPDGVPSGTAGYLAERDTLVTAAWIICAVVLIAAATTTGVVVTRRRSADRV